MKDQCDDDMLQICVGGRSIRESGGTKYLVGKHFYLYAWVIPFCLLYAIPWEYLYFHNWYAAYIDVVKSVLPVLSRIESSNIPFKEYAIAYLAFAHVLGFILAVSIFIYGLMSIKVTRHHKMLQNRFSSICVTFVLFAIVVFFLYPYAILFWDGSIPEKYPQYPVLRKDAFIIASILWWWGYLLLAFAVPAVFKLLIKKKTN